MEKKVNLFKIATPIVEGNDQGYYLSETIPEGALLYGSRNSPDEFGQKSKEELEQILNKNNIKFYSRMGQKKLANLVRLHNLG
jgi:hypothetical protein